MAKRFKGIPNLPFAPIAAVTFGIVFAILVFNTPDWRLERLVGATGLASVLPAAKPPLGSTARTLLSLLTALGGSGLLWAIMRPIESMIHARRMAASRAKARGSFIPAADIQMDEKPEWAQRSGRSPIFAEHELGAPFMSDEALSKGEELLLEPLPESRSVGDRDVEAPAAAIDLSDWQIDEEAVLVAPPVKPLSPVVPLSESAASLEAPVDASAEPVFAEPRPVSATKALPINDEVSLSELMKRLEKALDRRTAQGRSAADAPLAGNIASLHELIGLQRKSVI